MLIDLITPLDMEVPSLTTAQQQCTIIYTSTSPSECGLKNKNKNQKL